MLVNGARRKNPSPTSTPATNRTPNIQGPWGFPGALLYKPVREYGRFACLTDRFFVAVRRGKIGPLGAVSGRLCGPLSYCHRSVWQSRTNGHGAGKNHPATFLCIHPKHPPKTARPPRPKDPARAGFVLLFLGCFRGCVKNWKSQKMQLFRVEKGKRSVDCC